MALDFGLIRSAYFRLILTPGVAAAFKGFQRNYAAVFMLHRFHDPDRGIVGIDPVCLRRGLTYLRQAGYEFLSLNEIFVRLAGSRPLGGAVGFTIDDGYIEQLDIAAPIFAEFDCPVTLFLTTGFIDGELWLWWDKIEYILSLTNRHAVKVRLGDRFPQYDLSTVAHRQYAQMDFTERCKKVPDEEKRQAILALAHEADVTLPEKPPLAYSPVTWDQVRASEKTGVTFGPHTVTHPILSRTRLDQTAAEIAGSWNRLCNEVQSPLPLFCYPNGGWQDFGTREIRLLQDLSFRGAVVGEPGFADPTSFQADADGAFKVKRLAFPDSLAYLVQYVSGIERFKQILRRES
jgi:peptidoglycan/xylan/chitin deacetylase (PgdA/CDA1 family)